MAALNEIIKWFHGRNLIQPPRDLMRTFWWHSECQCDIADVYSRWTYDTGWSLSWRGRAMRRTRVRRAPAPWYLSSQPSVDSLETWSMRQVTNYTHQGFNRARDYKRFLSMSRCSTHNLRASVLPFQKCVNSVSGFANSVFYRFRFAKFRFLPFQIVKIPFHFFKPYFCCQ